MRRDSMDWKMFGLDQAQNSMIQTARWCERAIGTHKDMIKSQLIGLVIKSTPRYTYIKLVSVIFELLN